MNLDSPVQVSLEPTNTAASAEIAVPAPAPVDASQVPESSTWVLLIVAAALWLLRVRRRGVTRSWGR